METLTLTKEATLMGTYLKRMIKMIMGMSTFNWNVVNLSVLILYYLALHQLETLFIPAVICVYALVILNVTKLVRELMEMYHRKTQREN